MPIRKRLSEPPANVSKPAPARAPGKLAVKQEIDFTSLIQSPRDRIKQALSVIPCGDTMQVADWNNEWMLPFLKLSFQIRGVAVSIYPSSIRIGDGSYCRCNGALITVSARHPRTGMKHQLFMKPEQQVSWYAIAMHWMDDNEFFG